MFTIHRGYEEGERKYSKEPHTPSSGLKPITYTDLVDFLCPNGRVPFIDTLRGSNLFERTMNNLLIKRVWNAAGGRKRKEEFDCEPEPLVPPNQEDPLYYRLSPNHLSPLFTYNQM